MTKKESVKESVLVIVESPTKARTIGRILGSDYIVEASMGHLRDLPKSELGVDVEHNYEPSYVIPTKSRKTVTKLKKLYAESKELILATDEDREGEAIGWHITEALGVDSSKAKRIVFHEITDEAIKEAIASPRKIDIKLVHAQQARRVLDRLVGYKLSPLLWKKIFRGLSAGRVQSVAVRLIVERERERQKFVPDEYWKILVDYKAKAGKFNAELTEVDGEKIVIKNGEQAGKLESELKSAKAVIDNIEDSDRAKHPNAPFTTSTLQQQAGTLLGYTVKKTMMIAQQLYEGVDLGERGGHVGLITYMRTDSTYINPKVIEDIRSFVTKKFGKEYVPTAIRFYKTKDKMAQEAHEAIRPSVPSRTPEDIASFLSPDQQKLYRLIWERTISSQMADAIIDQRDVRVKADNKILVAQGVAIKFAGFMAVIAKNHFAEQILPALKIGEPLTLLKISPQQKFTEPPARYTEPSLIKALEKLGIGRPSTYMPTITTITARGYVGREKRQLFPLEVGFLVNDFLMEHFSEIVDFEFTANMEDKLDKIADGEEKWQEVIGEFYQPFAKKLAEKEKTLVKKDLDEETNEKCELCGAPMIIKMGRFGRFMACSKFPECKHTKSLAEKKVIMACPKCKTGQVVAKRTKRGKIFYGCDTYPKCDFASWDEPVKDPCPTCGKLMIISKKKKVPVCIGCGFEDKEIK